MEDFLSKKFVEDPNIGLRLFNSIIEEYQDSVVLMETYEDGGLLALDIFDNDISRKILSEHILYFDKYKEFCDRNFINDEQHINLIGLHCLHEKLFGRLKEMRYDEDAERFVFAENFIPTGFR